MTLVFEFPAFLWLLVLAPALWFTDRFGAGTRAPRHRSLHAAMRALLLVCLIGALAQPVLSWPASRLALIYLVDVSHSASTRALTSVADAIDASNRALGPAVSRILAFGGRDTTLPDTEAVRRLAENATPDSIVSRTAPEATNLEQALSAARSEIPPGMNGRIVLYSDGRETEGDSRRSAERLAAARVPVFAHTLPSRNLGDTWIESVQLPETAVVGAATRIDVVVGSQAVAEVDVSLRERDAVIGSQRVKVDVALTSIPIDVKFDAAGPHLISATLVRVGDPLTENNTLSREVVVEAKPRVLYVHTAANDANVAPAALVQAGFVVTRVVPRTLPTRAEAFTQWDVVVLSNIARSDLSVATMNALGAWVERDGGGLLFVGGSAVVGESVDRAVGGYRRTEVERLLPVTFDRDDEPEVALVIVLDRSWSMNGLAMDLSKTAAEAAANTLAPTQMLGILSFSNDATWDVPLSRVRDSRPTLHDAIQRIMASGPTAIYPALENAYVSLSTVRARAKHVILLSDGRQDPDDFEGLVKKMSAARITVSSVALGAEADGELLRNIANWGGGRNYVVQDANQIPEIFVKEAKNASTPGSDEDSAIRPSVRHQAFFAAGSTGFPTLSGRNVVTRKNDAIELIGTTRGDPILTLWPAGLGRTAMLSADVDGRWSGEWLKWRGFGAMLSTVVRALAQRREPPASLTVQAGERQGPAEALRVTLEVKAEARSRVAAGRLEVEVQTGAAGRGRVPLTQVAPGRYEANLVADTTEPLTFSLADPSSGPGVPAPRIVAVDRAAEYRFGPPNEEILTAITRATGGKLNPSDDDIRRAPSRSGVATHELAPWLLGIALVLWPADILLRRRWR